MVTTASHLSPGQHVSPLPRGQLWIQHQQVILVKVTFYVVMHSGCHKSGSGATLSGFQKINKCPSNFKQYFGNFFPKKSTQKLVA